MLFSWEIFFYTSLLSYVWTTIVNKADQNNFFHSIFGISRVVWNVNREYEYCNSFAMRSE